MCYRPYSPAKIGIRAARIDGKIPPSKPTISARETPSAASAGVSWPLQDEMTDTALEAALFTAVGTKQGHRRHVEPDWAEIHRELKRKHVTLAILWDEYIERCPEGYRYSRFCELYRGWASQLSVTMRQTHIGGDKLDQLIYRGIRGAFEGYNNRHAGLHICPIGSILGYNNRKCRLARQGREGDNTCHRLLQPVAKLGR